MAMDADVLIKIAADVKQAVAGFKVIKKEISKMGAQTAVFAKDFDKQVKGKVGGGFKALGSQAKKGIMEFQGWALSIMFFGMALKSVFDSIWRSSTKTFNDVMHSVEGSVTAFDMLDGSLKYLGFTIGDALEPVAAWLVPIVDKISLWVSENEELTAKILITIGVLGALFMFIGIITLALFGFGQAIIKAYEAFVLLKTGFTLLKAAMTAGFFTKIGTAIAAIGTKLWAVVVATWAVIGPWVILIAIIAAAIALFISLKATWKQVVTGWILKVKLMNTIWKSFTIGMRESFLNVIEKLIPWFDKLVKSYNKIAGVVPFMKEIATEDIISQKTIDDARAALAQLKRENILDQQALTLEAAANSEEAAANFKEAWSSVLDEFKTGVTDITDTANETGETAAAAGESKIVTDSSQTTSIIEIGEMNITQQPGENNDDFIDRVLEQMRASQ